jgi:hypothetical protein
MTPAKKVNRIAPRLDNDSGKEIKTRSKTRLWRPVERSR